MDHVKDSSIWHTVNFEPALLEGDSIISATATPLGGLTAGTPQVISAYKVDVLVGGGQIGVPAQVTVVATTSQGETLPWTLCFDVVRKMGEC